MPPDSAGTRRHAVFALAASATIACSTFAALIRIDPPSTAGFTRAGAAVATSVAPIATPSKEHADRHPAQVPGPGDIPDASSEGTWEVRGRVVDPEGRPVADVVIEVLQAGSPTIAQANPTTAVPGTSPLAAELDLLLARPDNLGVTQGRIPPIPLLSPPGAADLASGFVSDTHGYFTVTGTQLGLVELFAAPAGWAPTKSGPIAVSPGKQIAGVEVVLARGARLDGVIVDSNGGVLGSVKVETFCPADPVPRSTLSDRHGRFTFSGLLGACELVATPAELPSTRLAVTALEGETQVIEVRVSAEAHTLESLVEDSRGFPIANAAVEVRGSNGAVLLAAGLSAADGAVSIPRLPAPPYRVTVSHPDYAPQLNVKIASVRDNHIRLSAGTHVVGAVVTAPGHAPLPAARIEVWSGAGLLLHATRTGDLGTFEIRNVTAGDYSIVVTQPQTVQKRFTRQVGDVDPHDRRVDWGTFEVSEAGSISGTVVDRLGTPVPTAHVFTTGGETITDGDGGFTLGGLAAGSVVVQARHRSAGATTRGTTVRVFAGQDSPGARLQLAGRAEEPSPTGSGSNAGGMPEGNDGTAATTPPAATASENPQNGPTLELATGRSGVTVVSVMAGSTAAKAGLQAGDVIASIDNETVSVAGQARSILRGQPGSLVTLDVRRGNGRHRIKFRRQRGGVP